MAHFIVRIPARFIGGEQAARHVVDVLTHPRPLIGLEGLAQAALGRIFVGVFHRPRIEAGFVCSDRLPYLAFALGVTARAALEETEPAIVADGVIVRDAVGLRVDLGAAL